MNNGSYFEILENKLKEYNGCYPEIIKYLPQLLRLLESINENKNIAWKDKLLINSGFSYLALTQDAIPDNETEGYIDDLFLIVYILTKLMKDHKSMITANWKEDVELEELLQISLLQTRNYLREKTKKIFDLTGINKINELIDSETNIINTLGLRNNISHYDEVKYDLIVLLNKLPRGNGRVKNIKLKQLKDTFNKKEWEGVIHVLEQIEVQDKKYDMNHEIELDKIKQKILLDIDDSIFND